MPLRRSPVACLLTLLLLLPLFTQAADRDPPPAPARVEVEEVGKQQIALEHGQHGLAYFPDEGICILGRNPLRFLMVAGNETWLMQGPAWAKAVPQRKVLVPSADGPDNGYAGVGGVHVNPSTGTVYAFYHAEDQKGYKPLKYNGVPNFMASICLAVASPDGKRVEKRGPVLTTFQAKDPDSAQPQGVADVTVCPSADRKYLYAWYTDHSREGNRGVQICLARSPLSDLGKPGSWSKWHKGDFGEPGLGGHETPVLSLREAGADAWAPNVTYVPECGRYLMVFNATVYDDFKPGATPAGGIRFAHSADGIRWSNPVPLVTALGVPVPGKECAIHPTFVVTKATGRSIEGILLYGYSPKWGHKPEEPSHHLAMRSVRLKVTPE